MSRCIIGLSKLYPLKHMSGLRLFSSGPFVRLGGTVTEDIPDVLFFDAAKEELLTVPDKPLPEELDVSRVVGTSHGWGFFSNNHDRSLHISDYLNPLSSKSEPKVIPLPPLTSLYTCQTQVFSNVALSSSPCDDDVDDVDCVVAVNFLGRQLSFCDTRPNHDWRWTNFVTPFNFSDSSNLMYSKRDRKFYLPVTGSNHLCSWDLHFKKDEDPKFHEFLFRNTPKLSLSEHELLDSCSKADHWVESHPQGNVSWSNATTHTTLIRRETLYSWCLERKRRRTRKKQSCVTLRTLEICASSFRRLILCLDACLSPGLVPNSIYLMESVLGVYDIATRDIRGLEDQLQMPTHLGDSEMKLFKLPYWLLPPVSMSA